MESALSVSRYDGNSLSSDLNLAFLQAREQDAANKSLREKIILELADILQKYGEKDCADKMRETMDIYCTNKDGEYALQIFLRMGIRFGVRAFLDAKKVFK